MPLERAAVLDDVDAGLAAYALGAHFTAHEHFESAWHALAPADGSRAEDSDRLAARALVQLAAAEVKRTAKQPDGVDKLLTKAEANLLSVDGSAFGLDARAIAGAAAVSRATGEGPVALPGRTARVGVLYLHGFASSPGSAKARRFAEALEGDGVAVRVPALDEGDFGGLTLSRALTRARRTLFDRTLVVGSSMGGYLAALLGPDPRVAALVLMAPAFELARRLEERHGAEAIARWRREGWHTVEHFGSGRPERLASAFLDDAGTHPPFPPIARPAYVLHGERDDTVPAALSRRAAREATAPVMLDVVDDDHALAASAERAIEAARALYRRHVLGAP